MGKVKVQSKVAAKKQFTGRKRETKSLTRDDLAAIFREKIPLTRAMGIQVVSVSPARGVVLRLPLKPNRNHKSTAFGGTLVAAQALGAWAYIMSLLAAENVDAHVVIQREKSEFLLPTADNFSVRVKPTTRTESSFFIKTLKRHGKARLQILAEVICRRRVVACFAGEYVALAR